MNDYPLNDNLFHFMTRSEKIVHFLLTFILMTLPVIFVWGRSRPAVQTCAWSERTSTADGSADGVSAESAGGALTLVNESGQEKETLIGVWKEYPATFRGFTVHGNGRLAPLDPRDGRGAVRGEWRLTVESPEKSQTYGTAFLSLETFYLTVPENTFPPDADGVTLTLRLLMPPKSVANLPPLRMIGFFPKGTPSDQVAPPKPFGIDPVTLGTVAAVIIAPCGLLWGMTVPFRIRRLERNGGKPSRRSGWLRIILFAAGTGLYLFGLTFYRFLGPGSVVSILLMIAVQWAWIFPTLDFLRTRIVRRVIEQRKMEVLDTP